MHLLRIVVFAEASFRCSLFLSYIDTKANHLADSLSRNNASYFLSKVHSVSLHPSPVSPQLLDLLLNQEADWTAPTWRRCFRSTFKLD